MEFIKEQENFTIVILKESKAPGYLQASWMHDMGILNEEEWKNVKNVVLGLNISQFSISDSMQVLCNTERIQVGTNDVTKINRLVSICQGIVECYDIGNDKFSAAGVNTEFMFSFVNKDDSLKFGNLFVPFKNWSLFSENPRVMEFAVTDEARSSVDVPRRNVKFSSVGYKESKKDGPQIQIINANSNYHFEARTRDDIKQVLGKAEACFASYLEFINHFLKDTNLE